MYSQTNIVPLQAGAPPTPGCLWRSSGSRVRISAPQTCVSHPTTQRRCAHLTSVTGSRNLSSQGEIVWGYRGSAHQYLSLFSFSSQDLSDQFSPGARQRPDSGLGGLQLRHGIASLLPSVRASTASGSMMSPPMSPAKKTGKDPDKPKRPMNGFMLFAKKYRLELIQQHPGKDNR